MRGKGKILLSEEVQPENRTRDGHGRCIMKKW